MPHDSAKDVDVSMILSQEFRSSEISLDAMDSSLTVTDKSAFGDCNSLDGFLIASNTRSHKRQIQTSPFSFEEPENYLFQFCFLIVKIVSIEPVKF